MGPYPLLLSLKIGEWMFNIFKPNVKKMLAKKDVPGLAKLLKTQKDIFLKQEAVKALGNFSATEVFDILMSALKDENIDVQIEAIKSLGKLKDACVIKPLFSLWVGKNRKIEAEIEKTFMNMGILAIDTLKGFIKEDNFKTLHKSKVLELLAKIRGGEKVVFFSELLEDKDEDERVQSEALEALEKIADEKVVDLLIRLLKEDNRRQKLQKIMGTQGYVISIIRALGQTKSKRAVEPILQILEKSESITLKHKAIGSLAMIGNEQAVEFLLKFFRYNVENAHDMTRKRPKGGGYLKGEYDIYFLTKCLAQTGNKRAVEDIVNFLFNDLLLRNSTTREIDRVKSNHIKAFDFINLFADYTELVYEAATYTAKVTDEGYSEDKVIRGKYSTEKSDGAVKKLCSINSPISSNILHHVAKKQDLRVKVCLTLWDNTDQILSFESQREMAKKELKNRGNPAYDPALYLDESAWNL